MRTYNIGRNASNNVILDDKTVSRQHAQLIVLDDGRVILKDLSSSNGTFVNGNRISEYELKAGDIVKCGNSFVKWTQCLVEACPPTPENPAENPIRHPNILEINESKQDYSFGETLRYLSTKIFNIGDIFQTDWNSRQVILYYSLAPVILSFVCLMYLYIKINVSYMYQVVIPLVIVVFNFGVSQFLALGLLSLFGSSASIKKTLLGSSILSFLMCLPIFIPVIIATPFIAPLIQSGDDIFGSSLLFSFLILFLLPLLLCVIITSVIHVNRFFQAIGITKGISLHLTVFAFFLNALFSIAFTYFLISLGYQEISSIIDMVNFSL